MMGRRRTETRSSSVRKRALDEIYKFARGKASGRDEYGKFWNILLNLWENLGQIVGNYAEIS
jgi:hypothetical protein